MPLKAGLNGTFREYSSTNGRYVRSSLYDELLKNAAIVQRKAEKERAKRNELDQRAFKSKDPFLCDVYQFIQNKMPGIVQHINENVYFPSDSKNHEVDIICKNAIIEVKSSSRPHCLSQVKKQMEYASKRKNKQILFAPNINSTVKQTYVNEGVKVCTTKNELLEELKK